MNTHRTHAIQATTMASAAVKTAFGVLSDSNVHPNQAADYIRDVQRWAGHALAHLGEEARASREQ